MVIRDRFRAIRITRLVGAALTAFVLVVLMSGPLMAQLGGPPITSLSPDTGPPGGGTSVQIRGTFFSGVCDDGNADTADSTTLDSVKFGNNPATSIEIGSDNNGQIVTAVSPAGSGAVSVSVSTSCNSVGPGINNVVTQTSVTPPSLQFTYAADLTLASGPPATAQVGVAYSQTNVASGGTTPYTYTLITGALPTGTTLNASTGLVSGTPTTAGSFCYTIKVTDSGSPRTDGTTTTCAPLRLRH